MPIPQRNVIEKRVLVKKGRRVWDNIIVVIVIVIIIRNIIIIVVVIIIVIVICNIIIRTMITRVAVIARATEREDSDQDNK